MSTNENFVLVALVATVSDFLDRGPLFHDYRKRRANRRDQAGTPWLDRSPGRAG